MSSDDIVTRLRECWCSIDYTARGRIDPCCNHDGWLEEAADEIERLRSEKRQLQAELALAQKWRDNYKLAFDNSQKSCKYWHEKANSTNG